MFPSIHSLLEKIGYKCPLDSGWYERINRWEAWYQGRTPFHTYRTYNGREFLTNKKNSLKMAKTICEDKADIQLNEHTDIIVEDEEAQKYLDDTFDATSFWDQANKLVEKVGWSGTGAFVEYKDGEDTDIDYVNGTNIYPLAWHNDKFIACAFTSIYVDQKRGQLMYITIHEPDEVSGLYQVKNFMFDEHGAEVPLPRDVMQSWNSGSEYPTFQIVKLGMLNNLDKDNPMGIAIYANAIDVLKALDNAFDSLANEFILGRKRIFVDSSIVNIDVKDGEPLPIFDPNDIVFYGIPGLSGDDGKNLPIKESNMDLRVKDHVDTIQAHLDLLSMKSGFGKGFYKFEAMQVTTATEVVSTDSKLYRRVRKDEISLGNALKLLTRVLLFLGGFDPEQEISIRFDDSVIEDTNAIAMRNLQEYQAGTISLEQYDERVNNLREKAAAAMARKTRQQLAKDQPDPMPGQKLNGPKPKGKEGDTTAKTDPKKQPKK
jgi:A118 family predicted phage portal protein